MVFVVVELFPLLCVRANFFVIEREGERERERERERGMRGNLVCLSGSAMHGKCVCCLAV